MEVNSISTGTRDGKTTVISFLCSLVLHIGLLTAFFTPSKAPLTKNIPESITVFPVQLPIPEPQPELKITQPKRQIVSMPDKTNGVPPKNARFLSDKDSSTKVETIKRGDGKDAGIKGFPASATKKVSPIPPKPSKDVVTKPTNRIANTPTVSNIKTQSKDIGINNKNLLTKKLDLSTDFALLNKLNVAARGTKDNETLREPAPFSRGMGTNAKFIGVNGTSDYIPDIKDGDITLLNTKADQYAVFVRRVATAVFYSLKDEGWRSLAASDIRAIRNDAVVFARLSQSGKLLSATLQKSSGSTSFDSSVLEAVKTSARDPHPPSAALSSNGTYDFIFMAKAWSRMGMAMRNGFPREERWLLLKTGLE